MYRDPTVKFFYFDRITRSKILKSANSLFKFIVINKKFEDYFGSRVELHIF
jgi:phage anti-repressor protein